VVVELLGRVARDERLGVRSGEGARDDLAPQVSHRFDRPPADRIACDRDRDARHRSVVARLHRRLPEKRLDGHARLQTPECLLHAI
jgi:hypothetical protein